MVLYGTASRICDALIFHSHETAHCCAGVVPCEQDQTAPEPVQRSLLLRFACLLAFLLFPHHKHLPLLGCELLCARLPELADRSHDWLEPSLHRAPRRSPSAGWVLCQPAQHHSATDPVICTEMMTSIEGLSKHWRTCRSCWWPLPPLTVAMSAARNASHDSSARSSTAGGIASFSASEVRATLLRMRLGNRGVSILTTVSSSTADSCELCGTEPSVAPKSPTFVSARKLRLFLVAIRLIA